MGFNRVMLIGRRTEANFAWTPGEYARIAAAIRVENTYQTKEGTQRTVQTTLPLVASGGMAEVVRDIPADQDVSIEGRLRVEQGKAPDGSFWSRYYVIVERCEYPGAPPGASAQPQRRSPVQRELAGAGA